MDLNRMLLIFAIFIVIIWMLMRARTEMLEVKKKKTIEAVSGELVGFHENWILAAPKHVHIHKGKN